MKINTVQLGCDLLTVKFDNGDKEDLTRCPICENFHLKATAECPELGGNIQETINRRKVLAARNDEAKKAMGEYLDSNLDYSGSSKPYLAFASWLLVAVLCSIFFTPSLYLLSGIFFSGLLVIFFGAVFCQKERQRMERTNSRVFDEANAIYKRIMNGEGKTSFAQ